MSEPETVYAHVERTVHALLDSIIASIPAATAANAPDGSPTAWTIKMFADAVQALSSWPQFNPMNAHEQYQKLAEYEVEQAMNSKIRRLQEELRVVTARMP
jgi:hypothetical protein